ncbi:MAG: hypothetical protein QM656_04360 [Paracoccaceae bacterium]
MVDKTAFSPDEWNLVLASPMLVSTAITLADPSGLWGTIKESMAGATSLAGLKKDPGANAIAQAILADFETSEGRSAARDALKADLSGKSTAEMKTAVLAKLAALNSVLAAKAPAEAAAFKDWLKGIAQKTAEASSEGGFLGFGGVKVSEAEKATLAEITAALG